MGKFFHEPTIKISDDFVLRLNILFSAESKVYFMNNICLTSKVKFLIFKKLKNSSEKA